MEDHSPHSPQNHFLNQLGRFSSPGLVAILVFILLIAGLRIFAAVDFDWNFHRLASSVSWARGINGYTYPPDGVLVCGVNGPLQVLAYLPAGIASYPSLAVWIGTTLTIFYFFFPALLFFRSVLADTKLAPHEKRQEALTLFCFFVLMAWTYEGLWQSSGIIHADAPAIFFGALCLWTLIFSTHRQKFLVASLLAVFAALTKITFLPCLGLPPLMAALSAGNRDSFKRFCNIFFIQAALATTLLAFFSWLLGRPFWFGNLIAIFHVPWTGEPVNTGAIVRVGMLSKLRPLLLTLHELGQLIFWPLCTGIGLALVSDNRLTWKNKSHIPALSSLLLALLLLPTSIMGRAKVGGNWNTLSPSLFFFVLGFTALLRVMIPRAKWMRAMTIGLAMLTVVNFPRLYHLNAARAFTPARHHDNVYDWLLKHPTGYLFPEFPLAHLMALREPSHSWVNLDELVNVGLALPKEWIRIGPYRSPAKILFLADIWGPVKNYFPDYSVDERIVEFASWPVLARHQRN